MNTFFTRLTAQNRKSPLLRERDPDKIPAPEKTVGELERASLKITQKMAPTTLTPKPSPVPDPVHELPVNPEEEGELTVDIYDRGDAIIIQSTVAGVRPEDLDVSITNDTVSIRGRRERPEQISENSYYYRELFWGVFSRSVILPEEIEDGEAEASLKYGLLSIRLPKKHRGIPQKIKIKAV